MIKRVSTQHLGHIMVRVLLFLPILAAAPRSPLSAQVHNNIAEAQGLDFIVNSDLYGSGVSFHDFDNDGWDDLSFAATNDSLHFYRNVGGTLQRMPSPVNGAGEVKQVLWVDYDNDGDADLFTTTFEGLHKLYRNDGGWTFVDVSQSAGLLQTPGPNFGAAWGDYDRDGLLDLYVCSYVAVGNASQFELLNHLYHNNGDGTFTDVTLAAGVGNGIAYTFQAVWMDHDRDGWPDLYLINDREFDNTLYRNNGDGTFTDVTAATGSALSGQDPMTLSVADFDNDGDLDIFMTNTGIPIVEQHCKLLVKNAIGSFDERSVEFGLDAYVWSWGGVWVDLENDGWQDLFFATGQPLVPPVPDRYYRNVAGTFFQQVSVLVGEPAARGFGCARGDLNNDGFQDIVVQNQAPRPAHLWLHDGTGGNWIKFSLQGTASNRMAIGSWVEVYANGMVSTRYTHCGEGFVSQNSQRLIVGLGNATSVDSVVVRYLSGHVDRYVGLDANNTFQFIEGDTYQAQLQANGPLGFCVGGSVLLDAGEHSTYLWNTGALGRYLEVGTSGTYWAQVTNAFGVSTTSDTLSVTVHPLPTVLIAATQPDCFGASTGSIMLSDLSGATPASVVWSTGATSAIITGLEAGSYGYSYTDQNGCNTSGDVLLQEPLELLVIASSEPADQSDNGSILVQVFGGVPPYTILLNGMPSGTVNTGFAAGTYTLEVIDANGCIEEQQLTVDDWTGVEDLLGATGTPRYDELAQVIRWREDRSIKDARLFDGQGRELLRVRSGSAGQIPVAHLPAGVYLLSYMDSIGMRRGFRFVKR